MEALKKFEEVIVLKKEVFGDRSETVNLILLIIIIVRLWNHKMKQLSFVIFYQWVSFRKVYINTLIVCLENFSVALELLRKAETLTDESDRFRAVTYNNFACIFRRTKKLRSALNYLEKALEIEYNYLHNSEEAVDDCL